MLVVSRSMRRQIGIWLLQCHVFTGTLARRLNQPNCLASQTCYFVPKMFYITVSQLNDYASSRLFAQCRYYWTSRRRQCLLQRLAVYEDGWMKGEHGLSCIEDISVTTSRDRQTPWQNEVIRDQSWTRIKFIHGLDWIGSDNRHLC